MSASQPLYRPANFATWEQGKRQVELAQAQLTAASQDLIIRVSQAYFDVLAAQDTLAFVQAQKTAVAEQLASAKRNFEVGTSTITDTREAQARYDLVIAQEIAAENDLRVKKLALDALVGKPDVKPNPLAVPVIVPAPQPADVNVWVQQGEENSPSIQQAKTARGDRAARNRKGQGRPQADARPDGQLQRHAQPERQHHSAGASTRSNTASVGVSFNLPLFAGFATQNRIRETLSLEEKAQADLEADAPHRRAGRAHAPSSAWCRARARSRRWKPPKPPARARSKPTAWATRWACASTSTCSTRRASCSRPSATWRRPATTCCSAT